MSGHGRGLSRGGRGLSRGGRGLSRGGGGRGTGRGGANQERSAYKKQTQRVNKNVNARGSQSEMNLASGFCPEPNVFYRNIPPPYTPFQQYPRDVLNNPHVQSANQIPFEYKRERTPPPSYQEVDKMNIKKNSSKKLKAEAIVKALALLNGQWATAVNIGKLVDHDSKTVVEIVKANKNLFSVMNNGNEIVIELVPKISICMDYLSDIGCESRMVCGNLHICKHFILSKCTLGAKCHFGHKWDTSHNSQVLSKLYLDMIDRNVLHELMKKICKGILPPQICNYYNSENGCKYGEKCGQLHVCKDFVKRGGKCFCSSYSHDIMTPQSKRILKNHDLPINESPRDIIMSLKAVIAKQEVQDNITKTADRNPKEAKAIGKNDSGREGMQNEKEFSDSESTGDARENKVGKIRYKKETDKERVNEGKPNKEKRTTMSTDIFGDVKIPGICVFSIDDKCRNESRGCNYLHAKSPFHWQAKKNQHWYNFRIFQSKTLESAFCDVSKSSVMVNPLIVNKLGDNAKQLLSVFGTETWMADFQAMTIKSSAQEELKIRRIATKSAADSTSPKATVYKWYFIDDQGKWIRYGEVDSFGNQQFVLTVTSEEIEKQYISDPSSYIEISNSRFKYKLDFSKMRQINLDTGREREIRRRPAHLAYQRKPESDQEATLPTHWCPMPSNQTHTLQRLDANNSEYIDIARLVRMTLPTLNIVSIQRLQNPYLWRLFQYKIASLTRSHNENQMNVQKLFHAVEPGNIDTICKENFDWRQTKTTASQEFGKGAYFFNRAGVTRKYCIQNREGHYFLFVAQVIIGSVHKGSPELTRPPFNPSTNSLYNTSVDDEHNTTIFVKYDKEDYYPEYLVEFT